MKHAVFIISVSSSSAHVAVPASSSITACIQRSSQTLVRASHQGVRSFERGTFFSGSRAFFPRAAYIREDQIAFFLRCQDDNADSNEDAAFSEQDQHTDPSVQLLKSLQDLSELSGSVNTEDDDPSLQMDAVMRAQDSAQKLIALLADTRQQLAAVENDFKQSENRYYRSLADFENFRQRTTKEKAEIEKKAIAKVAMSLLPLLDNFERAQEMIFPETEREQNIHGSYQAVYKLMVDNLTKLGIQAVNPTGDQFDPRLHEAFSRIETDEQEDGTVVQTLRKGYTLGDTLLRAAAVAVAKGNKKPAAPAAEVSGEEAVAAAPAAEDA